MRGLNIPFTQMGRVSSLDLFEPREQEIFDFYERNAGRYDRALDIGANLGIHTILMARAGWEVRAYEPDPGHYAHLVENIRTNLSGGHGEVQAFNAAVSTKDGTADFTRVMQNGTANHLSGAREHHGPVERITVSTIDCRHLFAWADIAKVDCEGAEAEILCTVRPEWRCEFLVEVGNTWNAKRIFDHFRTRRMWVQRGPNWYRVHAFEDMPKHYTQGTLFIGEHP